MKNYIVNNGMTKRIYYKDIKDTSFKALWNKMHDDYFCASMADFGADREQREVLYDYTFKFKVTIIAYHIDNYGNKDNEYIEIR